MLPAEGITGLKIPDFTHGSNFSGVLGETKTRQTSSGRADIRLPSFRNLPGSSQRRGIFHVPPSMAIAAGPVRSERNAVTSTPGSDLPFRAALLPPSVLSTCRLPWRSPFDLKDQDRTPRVQVPELRNRFRYSFQYFFEP